MNKFLLHSKFEIGKLSLRGNSKISVGMQGRKDAAQIDAAVRLKQRYLKLTRQLWDEAHDGILQPSESWLARKARELESEVPILEELSDHQRAEEDDSNGNGRSGDDSGRIGGDENNSVRIGGNGNESGI